MTEMVSFRLPDPPSPLPHRIAVKQGLTRGRCSGCCVCHRSCWTWWSPRPPSGYVPLHAGCVMRLFEQWRARLDGEDGTAVVAPVARSPVARTGAYARLTSAVPAQPERATAVTVALTGQRAAILPDDFTPGPFWRPGDTADSPWTVVAETASGRMTYPFDSHEHAYEMALRLDKLRATSDRILVVAATLVDPQGYSEAVWGKPVIMDDPPRWRPVIRVNDWTHCQECGELRWPGTWAGAHRTVCLSCLARGERDDPRPTLSEPSYPGDQYVPEWVTKTPKPLALPKGFRRRR